MCQGAWCWAVLAQFTWWTRGWRALFRCYVRLSILSWRWSNGCATRLLGHESSLIVHIVVLCTTCRLQELARGVARCGCIQISCWWPRCGATMRNSAQQCGRPSTLCRSRAATMRWWLSFALSSMVATVGDAAAVMSSSNCSWPLLTHASPQPPAPRWQHWRVRGTP